MAHPQQNAKGIGASMYIVQFQKHCNWSLISASIRETIEEFEPAWESLLDKYNVEGNDWLPPLYLDHKVSVPIYFETCSSQECLQPNGVELTILWVCEWKNYFTRFCKAV